MRIKITVSYDGTNYSGWQVQGEKDTIQLRLEKAVESVTGKFSRVTGSGRTDTGVHALGQTAHFDTDSAIPPAKFAPALNSYLPKDIRILSSERVEEDFHARFSAKRKTYIYNTYISKIENPLLERYAVRAGENLNIKAMKDALGDIIGEHNFKAFCSSGSSVNGFVREVFSAELAEKEDKMVLRITGSGFLYNMVRIIAGTLMEIGAGKREPGAFARAVSTGERKELGKTAPAKGLILYSVEY